jgi:hypothetical protein
VGTPSEKPYNQHNQGNNEEDGQEYPSDCHGTTGDTFCADNHGNQPYYYEKYRPIEKGHEISLDL